MSCKLVSFILCSAVSLGLLAQDWELSKSENNIRVYTGKSDSSKYKIIKVEAEMEGTLQKLVAILRDVSNNKNWVYNTIESHLIREIDDNELLYYAETHIPWPFSNRDMVIRMHFDLDTVTNDLKIKATGEPGAVPEVSNKVRIPKFYGDWRVKFDGVNKITIVYFLEVNPGGNVSPAISNLFVTKGPFETFYNLSKLLAK